MSAISTLYHANVLYLICCTCGLWFPLVEYKSSVLVRVCVLSVFCISVLYICLLKYSSAASYRSGPLHSCMQPFCHAAVRCHAGCKIIPGQISLMQLVSNTKVH